MVFRLGSIALVLVALSVASTNGSAQTKATDKVPPFALAYFVGEWAFDWSVPESAIGPAGDLAGKETFRLLGPGRLLEHVPGYPDVPNVLIPKSPASLQVIESWFDAVGPAGPVKARAVMIYDSTSGRAARHEIDAAGNVLVKEGKITGDLGGIYSFTWETAPFERGEHRLRLRGRTVAFSPHNFRDFIQYAVDGGDFVTYGQPWYRKAGQ